MAIVNLRQASAHLGFRTTTTLRRLLKAGELSAYVRSGPDLRATYLDVAPKGRPTLRQYVQAHMECRGNSPLWSADYEGWPKPNGHWTEVANSYLDLPQWGPPPIRLSVQCPGRHKRHRQASNLSADITVLVCGYSKSGTKTRF